MSYTKNIVYTFEVNDEGWEVDYWGKDFICVIQEDYKLSVTIELRNGAWVINPEDRVEVIEHYGGATAKALEQFITLNGLPE